MATAVPIPAAHWWVFLLEGIAAILFGLPTAHRTHRNNPSHYCLPRLLLALHRCAGTCACLSIAPCPWIWSLLIGILGIVADRFCCAGLKWLCEPYPAVYGHRCRCAPC